MVQRCPAVPDGAEQDGAQHEIGIGIVDHDDAVVAAELEHRAAQALGDDLRRRARPIRTSRSRETSGMRAVGDQALADLVVGADDQVEDAGRAVLVAARRLAMRVHRDRGERGLRATASRSRESPQTAAIIAFHAHTATGKLKAVITPTDAERVPLLVHAMPGPLAVHGQAVELARQADREVGDVDHLLHFAQAFAAGSCRSRA